MADFNSIQQHEILLEDSLTGAVVHIPVDLEVSYIPGDPDSARYLIQTDFSGLRAELERVSLSLDLTRNVVTQKGST